MLAEPKAQDTEWLLFLTNTSSFDAQQQVLAAVIEHTRKESLSLEKTYEYCKDFKEELIETANKIGTRGKGILAVDESTGTIGKRFDSISLENTEENRRAYRELLFTAPDLEQYISGTIMYDETVRQSTKEGIPFCDLIRSRDVICGIKVDAGVQPIEGTDDETVTVGLDGLDERCAEYYRLGCRFAKWRGVLKIGDGLPSDVAIEKNA